MEPTRYQRMIEGLYGGDLAHDVAWRRGLGYSWRKLAILVSNVTGEDIAGETLRQWYGGHAKSDPTP